MQKKTIIERGGLGAPHPTPTVEDYLDLRTCKATIFHLTKQTVPL